MRVRFSSTLVGLGRCVVLAALLAGTVSAPALTNLNLSLVSNVKPSASPISYGDVWAEGDLACLGVWLGYSSYNYGVGIYSIANPAAPVLLGVQPESDEPEPV